jgi:glycosyltransferase involved in cell wall biosynthesis
MYEIYNDSLNYSGNNTTLIRLSKLLNLRFTNIIKNNIIGIHAYKFGKKVINKNINFIIIIGGTDINIDVYNASKLTIIRKCLEQAKFIIAFNKYIYNRLLYFNINISKIKIIKQSVPILNPVKFYNLRNKFNIRTKKIFLLVGNIRPVKDVYFLKNIFDNFNMTLIIIGNIINGNYNFGKNIIHLDGLESNYIYDCMKQVDGLINTSKSEGMSIAILEAMKLKCPVYARNNEGNKSIIKHLYNGFIFENSFEFYKYSEYNVTKIIDNAYKYVSNIHNTDIEKLKYYKILIR